MFLSLLTGSFATPAAENPTVVMVEAAYRHHGLSARYLNCEVAPEALDVEAVRDHVREPDGRVVPREQGRRLDGGHRREPMRHLNRGAAVR
jgi:hypothetical protein